MDEALQVRRLEKQVGNPADRWVGLKERIQQEDLQRVSEIRQGFLDILWCLDLYRVAGVPPRGMGNPNQAGKKQLEGAYRMKGGWFAELISLVLENQTRSSLAPRTSVQGFSQNHQIDIAWPPRRPRPIRDPLVCVETKVMGGPAYGGGKERPALADWSNRRKELKFQATDLKLYRRQQETRIEHWDDWRRTAAPSVYFLWCARLTEGKDNLSKMVTEVRALTDTYLDGAGILAYRPNPTNDGYEHVPIPWPDRIVRLDDVVHRIASEINGKARPDGRPPEPQIPSRRAVEVRDLEPDDEQAD